MWCDSIKYDHAYTEFESASWGVSFIYQQSGSRTNFMSGSCFTKNNLAVEKYMIQVDEDTFNKIGNICVEREGRPYGVKQILGKAIVKLLFLVSLGSIRSSNPFENGDDETDCIEEQAYLISKGLNIPITLDMDSVTVKPYRDFIASLPNVKRIE